MGRSSSELFGLVKPHSNLFAAGHVVLGQAAISVDRKDEELDVSTTHEWTAAEDDHDTATFAVNVIRLVENRPQPVEVRSEGSLEVRRSEHFIRRAGSRSSDCGG